MLAGNDEESFAMLRGLLEQDPGCAEAHYLLGAQHAQLGEMDLAEQAFMRALQLSPGLTMARFQLGQLLLVTGRNAEATQLLAPLTESADAIGSYATGLISIANQQIDLAISQLQMGLAQAQPLEALQMDMQALVHMLGSSGTAQGGKPGEVADTLPGASMLLSNYNRYN
ncbi:tetratricopeptide repeat protein [Xanthomonas campestris pv. badrii]|uniref:Tetratricopeptide repeat protein n=2 Tax=Xanthomonas campestris TaxID=339 RepID=A0A7Z2VEL3_XANCA|nr:tetratricopeptide repeat protein [Xanthomonas campestris pv. badrii]